MVLNPLLLRTRFLFRFLFRFRFRSQSRSRSRSRFLTTALLLIGLVIVSLSAFEAMASERRLQEVRIIPPQSRTDKSHDYFHHLLQKALEVTEDRYGPAVVTFAPHVIEQGRAVADLNDHNWIDVYWMGTSLEREKELTAIRIPLVKGLLGYRGLVMTARTHRSFTELQNPSNLLKTLTACQGMHWPDSDILEAAGFKVARSARFETLYAMLERNRCDIFPRGVHEGPAEVEIRRSQGAGLVWEDKALIYYPFPMYFFTSQSNSKLAERIRAGLERMIDNGSFEAFMREHPVTQHLFPLEQWPAKVAIRLANPELPADTDVHNPRYWVVP